MLLAGSLQVRNGHQIQTLGNKKLLRQPSYRLLGFGAAERIGMNRIGRMKTG